MLLVRLHDADQRAPVSDGAIGVWIATVIVGMAARAIWKGTIAFGDVRVPVKLYSAVQDRRVHFRLLHAADRVPVKQTMVHPATGEPVASDEVQRGIEVESGVFVLVRPDEQAGIEPEPDRLIRVTRFVDPAEISAAWYRLPYYLGPDGDDADYAALAEAIAREGREGIAHWTMRKKPYVGALRSEGGHLALIALRHEEEVAEVPAARTPPDRQPAPQERGLAEQLVGALAGRFDASAWHDEYRERVVELVQKKARGEPVEVPRRERPAPTPDLAGALRAGLDAVREARGG